MVNRKPEIITHSLVRFTQASIDWPMLMLSIASDKYQHATFSSVMAVAQLLQALPPLSQDVDLTFFCYSKNIIILDSSGLTGASQGYYLRAHHACRSY